MTGCATFVSKDCSQTFAITRNNSTWLWRNFVPLFFENYQNSTMSEGFQAENSCLIWVQPRSLQNLVVVFMWVLFFVCFFSCLIFFHLVVDLLLCFRSWSCCKTQMCLSFRTWTNAQVLSFKIFWKRAEFMVPSCKATRPGAETAKQSQTITPPRLTDDNAFYEMLFSFMPPTAGLKPSKKFNNKSLGGISRYFLANVRSLCSFGWAVVFTLELLGAIFA